MLISEVLPTDLLRDQTVFVTGGGSGINLGIARNFAAVGADLAICGRTQEKLDNARADLEQLGARVYAATADVRDYDMLASVIEAAGEELGPISTLVCAAAGNFLSPAEALSPNGFKSVVDIDLLGSFNASRAAFEQLKKTKGNIIFVSAGQSYIPYFAQVHAGAAKAGVDNLMRNLALEWGRFGIRSNSVVPGPTDGTEGVKRLLPGGSAEQLKTAIPLGRFATVDDIGQAAVFLASPLASYITGTVLIVDGGQNLPGSGLFSQIIMRAMQGGKAPRSH